MIVGGVGEKGRGRKRERERDGERKEVRGS